MNKIVALKIQPICWCGDYKDINEILEEALEEYFAAAQDRLLKDSIEKENAQTNLSFNEFWDGVDL